MQVRSTAAGQSGTTKLLVGQTTAVGNETQFDAAILAANGDAANTGAITIDVKSGISLTTPLEEIKLASGNTLTIAGTNGSGGAQSQTLDGGGMQRGLFVYAGTVTVENLALNDMTAQGAAGANGVVGPEGFANSGGGGGGGGAGLGGGLFVTGSSDGVGGAKVTLANVTFSGDAAIGGAGGGLNNTPGNSAGGAGGAGVFGPGGAGGAGGAPGIGTSGNGGNGGNGAPGGFGGGGGGGGGGGPPGGTNGSWGMGGNGAAGGFGGGGGGATTIGGGAVGAAGFGGGTPQFVPGGSAPTSGGGGLGAGGDIFVQQGGSLTIEAGTLGQGTVTGGGGWYQFGLPHPNDGKAYGDGIFLEGNETLTLAPAAGQVLTIDCVIADMTGSKDASGQTGAGSLALTGAGRVVLATPYATNNTNTFTGGITVAAGVLELATQDALGSGPLTIAGSSTIVVDAAADPSELSAAVQAANGAKAGTGAITVEITGGRALSGPLAIDLASGNAGTLAMQGAITNAASITLTGNGSATDLTVMTGGVTLSGRGAVSLAGVNPAIVGAASTATLTNLNNTIAGEGFIGLGSLTLINEAAGLIDASVKGQLVVDTKGETLVNAGLMESTPAGAILVLDATTIANAGGIVAGTGGVVDLENCDVIGGSLAGAQPIDVNTGASTLDGVDAGPIALGGTVQILSGAALTVEGTLNVTGAVDLYGSATLVVGAAGVTLTGGGQVDTNAVAKNTIIGATAAATLTNLNDHIDAAGQLGDGSMALINQAAGLISDGLNVGLTINTGASTIVNDGVIESDGAGGVAVTSAIANTGALTAEAGTLSLDGLVTGTGIAKVIGGVLYAAAASGFEENVAFSAAGTLKLGDSQAYTGTIRGFSPSGTTALDLADIAYKSGTTKATYAGTAAGGVLTVTSGTEVASIHLTGNYLAAKWTVTGDGAGGTKIVDPVGPGAAKPVTGQTSVVDNETGFNAAIAAADGAAADTGAITIDVTSGFSLTTPLNEIEIAAGNTLTIEGTNGSGGAQSQTLDGGGTQRGLFVYAGTVTVENLALNDMTAQGAAGVNGDPAPSGPHPSGGGGGGGGGAGLGGGLFVTGSSDGVGGAKVTLANVTFSGDAAVGGAAGVPAETGAGDARGGVGGAGILGPGGGGGAGGAPGIGTSGKGGGGGNGSNGGGFGAGGGGGGGGGDAGANGFGGNAGNGGAGGFGGGGGGPGLAGVAIGGGEINAGAFGLPGAGGFGGGKGDVSNGAGGGGLGAGGDIFVQQGGSLTIEGGTLGAGTVSGGDSHEYYDLQGKAYGDGIFLQGSETLALAPAAGQTLTISGVIADETGSNDPSKQTGAGSLDLTGAGAVVLSPDAANTFTGGITLASGSLELAAAGAAGSGAITFAGAASLIIDAADTPADAGTFASTITDFGGGDTVDLKGLTWAVGATASLYAGALTVFSGGAWLYLDLASPAGSTFYARPDGGGGVLVGVNVIPALAAPTAVTIAEGEPNPVAGVSLSETGAFAGETFSVTLIDATGLLGATASGAATVAGSGSVSLTVSGSLADVNATLASLTDAGTTAGPDTITINAMDSLGDSALFASVAVTSTPNIVWTNPAGGAFQTSADWTPGETPGGLDNAILSALASPYTVTASSSQTVLSIQTASSANLSVTGGTFTAAGGTGAGANAGAIKVASGATLSLGGTVDNSGTIALSSGDLRIVAAGATLSGGGAVSLAGVSPTIRGVSSSAVLTNVNNTIVGEGYIGAGAMTLINEAAGVIDASAKGQISVNTKGETLINAGLIEASLAGAFLVLNATTIANAGGTIAGVGGVVDLQNSDVIGGTLAGTTAIRVNTGSSTLDGASNGGISLAGNVQVVAGTTLTAEGTLSGTGSVNLYGGGKLIVGANGLTLTGGGHLNTNPVATDTVVGASATATLTNVSDHFNGVGQLGDGSMILVNEAAGTILDTQTEALTINTGTQTIANAGVIESDGVGGVTIASATANTGTLIAAMGTFTLDGALTGSGIGEITGGTLYAAVTAAFNEHVTFVTGATGALKLGDSRAYTSTISGFSKTGTTALDLADIAYDSGKAKATYAGTTAGGVLTVTSGTEVASIHLTGNYLAAKWTLTGDGTGGTTVIDPAISPAAASSAPRETAATHPFVQAMAGFGVKGHAAGNIGADICRLPPPALAMPRAQIA